MPEVVPESLQLKPEATTWLEVGHEVFLCKHFTYWETCFLICQVGMSDRGRRINPPIHSFNFPLCTVSWRFHCHHKKSTTDFKSGAWAQQMLVSRHIPIQCGFYRCFLRLYFLQTMSTEWWLEPLVTMFLFLSTFPLLLSLLSSSPALQQHPWHLMWCLASRGACRL